MTKVYDNATDLITFARSSSGTALRRVGYGDEIFGDPSFDGTGDWSLPADSVTVSGGKLTYDAVANIRGAEQNVNIYAGRVYQISFEVLSGTAYLYLSTGKTSPSLISGLGPAGYGVGVHQINVVANGNYSTIGFTLSKFFGGTACELAYFSMKEVIFDRATDDLVLFNHPDDIPRIEYAADGSLKGLLIEEQRTNLVTHSEDFSNAAWSKFNSIAVSPSAETAPNGQEVAYELTGIESGDGDTGLDEAVSASASTTYTGTIWFKAKSASDVGKYVRLRLKRIGGTFVEQNESVQLTNNWVRHEITLTLLSDNTGISLIITKDTTQNIVDRADECLIYGVQLEAGSFATSYIPASGSQSTRSPDIASIPVSAFGYNQDAGTVVVEYSKMYPDAAYNRFHAGFGANSGNYIGVGYSSAQRAYVQPLVGAITVSEASAPSPGEFATAAAGFDASGATAAVDGQSNSVTAIGPAPAFSQSDTLYLGASAYSPSEIASGHIKSLSYFPRRLTDAQLQELTS